MSFLNVPEDIDEIMAELRASEAREEAFFENMVAQFPSMSLRFARAALYALAALLLIQVQSGLPTSYILPLVIFLLAMPKRSVLLSEIALGGLIILTLLPALGSQL